MYNKASVVKFINWFKQKEMNHKLVFLWNETQNADSKES